jgi:hypothetical protein
MQAKSALMLFAILSIMFYICLAKNGREDVSLNYYNENIERFSPSLRVGRTKERGFGLFAKKDIKKGDEILRIPDHFVTTSFDDYPRSYFFFEFIHKDYTDFLMGRLLYEKFITKRGDFYKYYIEHLNEDSYKHASAFWTQEDVDKYWHRLGYPARDTFGPSKFQDRLGLIINENKKYLNQYEPKFPPEMFEEKELRWAYSLIGAYGVPFERFQWYELKNINPKTYKRDVMIDTNINYQENHIGFAMIPFLDLINHKTSDYDGTTYLLSDQFDLRNQETVETLKRVTGIKNPQQETVRLNSSDFNTTTLFDQLYFEVAHDDLRSHLKIRKGYITLLANRNYQKDEEITYSYGKKTNNNLLINYGFVDPKNPYDAFEYENFQMTDLPDLAKDACYKLDCAPWNQKFVSYFFHRNQINHRLLKLIRIFGQNKETLGGQTFDRERALIVARNGRFKNNYLELMTWKSYFNIIDYRRSFPTTIRQDRRDLEEEMKKLPSERDQMEINFIQNGISQKEIIYRHVNYAWAKYLKIMHSDILMGDLKNDILIIVEAPERAMDMFFHNHKDE